MTQTNNKLSLKKKVGQNEGEMQESIRRLEGLVAKLSTELHTVKGNLAANTSLTMEALDGLAAFKSFVQKIDVEKVVEVIGAIDSMKGGIKVLGWLERPAKWIAAIAGAIVALWALFKSNGG